MAGSLWGMVLHSDLMVKVVLLVLFFFSVISWAIMLFKWRYFSKAKKENNIFIKNFTSSRDRKALYNSARLFVFSPVANIFRAVFAERVTREEDVKRALKRFMALESSKLERYLNFLATTGSTAPFLGLFGTVWGLMNSFTGIGAAGSASLAVVAPGISQALTTTAAGLIAAIPAVVGYNFFLSMARRLMVEMQDFAEEIFEFFTG